MNQHDRIAYELSTDCCPPDRHVRRDRGGEAAKAEARLQRGKICGSGSIPPASPVHQPAAHHRLKWSASLGKADSCSSLWGVEKQPIRREELSSSGAKSCSPKSPFNCSSAARRRAS